MWRMEKGTIGRVVLPYRYALISTVIYCSPPTPCIVSLLRQQRQGLGSILVRKIDGDYNNVVGFPGTSFFHFLDKLVVEEDDFLEI